MADSGKNPLNPTTLSPADAAKMLAAVGSHRVSADAIRQDIDRGAPQNADGTLNLIHYAAWLVREVAGGH